MAQSKLEWKVGVFVFISLLLLGALIVKFSKGSSWFARTYQIKLEAENVGGIIPGAVVLMAGVPIGSVVSTDLNPGGRTVTITLEIPEKYRIHKDARFMIKQAGFLGDRVIGVIPTKNELPELADGDVATAESPYDFEQAARSATGLLQQLEDTVGKLSQTVTRIDRHLLTEQTLTNLAVTVANFRGASERALVTLQGINDFVTTNAHPMSGSVSNLVVFSQELNSVARELREIVSTNRNQVTSTMKHLEAASLNVDRLLTDLESGQGLAGSLLKNEALSTDFSEAIRNLNLLSSNLNRFGLLWKPKAPRTPKPSAVPYTGRSPFR